MSTPTAIAMPKLGMTMKEGTVISWPVSIGQSVKKGQVVLVIESEKAEVEIEATAGGTFRHIYVAPDETVASGTLLGALSESPDEAFDPEAFREAFERQRGRPLATARTVPTHPPTPATARAARQAERGAPVTPAARKLARELRLDPSKIPGSGPGDRVTREDVVAHAERRESLCEVAAGVRLDVPSEGEGETVLLLPGFGTDSSAFARQIPLLAADYCVRGVNPRGVGLSDAPQAERYEVATAAADLAALIETPAHVVGTSLGAAAAIELAITRPEKLKSLTLITPFARVGARLAAVSEAWCELAESASPALVASSLLPWLFGAATLADQAVRRRLARGLATTLAQVSPETLRRQRAGMLAWSGSREADLGRIATPTLVVVAGDDLLAPDALDIAGAVPGAACEIIAGAGHAVGLEAADAVNERLLRHLRG